MGRREGKGWKGRDVEMRGRNEEEVEEGEERVREMKGRKREEEGEVGRGGRGRWKEMGRNEGEMRGKGC